MLIGVGIEFQHYVTVQRIRECDPGEHRRSVSRHEHQRFDRDLPLRQFRLLLWQGGDVVGAQRVERSSVRERYRILEPPLLRRLQVVEDGGNAGQRMRMLRNGKASLCPAARAQERVNPSIKFNNVRNLT